MTDRHTPCHSTRTGTLLGVRGDRVGLEEVRKQTTSIAKEQKGGEFEIERKGKMMNRMNDLGTMGAGGHAKVRETMI